MGTENYDLADWDRLNKQMPIDSSPINLIIDKEKSYTTTAKDQMMSTEHKEAKVEYMLVKWTVNKKGGMKMILQSESFSMDGSFKEHDID